MKRRLAAILATDVVGYSRMMGRDEAGTLAALKAHRAELIDPKAMQYGGQTIKLMGDGALMEFASVVDAVRFAVEVQCAMRDRNADVAEDQRLDFRIGINIGDVIAEDGDIHGDGVNVAARLEGLAQPGGVCIRRNVRNQVRDKLNLDLEDLGDVEVKNIERPIRVFHIVLNEKAAALATAIVAQPQDKRSRWGRVAAAAALSLAVIAGIAWWQPWAPEFEPASVEKMAHPLPDKPSIAVLAFDNLSGDPEQEYFADGITENVITELSRFRNLFVIARNSTFTYKGRAVKVQEVSEDLGVRYVLEGSVQRSNDRVRITAQLIDAITGRHLWSERYDRDLDDLFAVQDDVTRQIVATLATETGMLADAWQKRTVREGTDSLKAYELDLQGWVAIMPWTKEAFVRGEELFKQAIAADPDYARPYANLALILSWQYYAKYTDEDALHRAVDLAREAIARDDGEAWGHWALGAAYLALGQHDEAVAAYEKALALNPNDADVLAETSFLLAWVGRADDGIENVETAIRLNPRYDDWYLWGLGVAYYDARRYREAADALASRKDPNLKSNLYLAAAYGQLGEQTEAQSTVQKIVAENPDSSIELWGRAQPYRREADQNHYIAGLRKAGLPEHPPLPLPDKPCIAVLAFDNLSGDPQQEYVSDGISEAIITGLSRFPELFVIARQSSFSYKGTAATVQQIAVELGVNYILEGSVQRSDGRIRVTGQLIDAPTGRHLWAQQYDRQWDDIFALQDDITQNIAANIVSFEGPLEEATRGRIKDKAPADLRAYDYLLLGRERFFVVTKEENAKARDFFHKAAEVDPNYSLGYAWLAWTHVIDVSWGWSADPAVASGLALDYARKAVELDNDEAGAHWALAAALAHTGKYPQRALAEYDRALALNPNNADLLAEYGFTLPHLGRAEEGIESIEKAMRLNPIYPDWYAQGLMFALYNARRYRDVIAVADTLSVRHLRTHLDLAGSYSQMGQLDDARESAAKVLEIDPGFSLRAWRETQNFTRPADLEHYFEGLRKAGLPE